MEFPVPSLFGTLDLYAEPNYYDTRSTPVLKGRHVKQARSSTLFMIGVTLEHDTLGTLDCWSGRLEIRSRDIC